MHLSLILTVPQFMTYNVIYTSLFIRKTDSTKKEKENDDN